MCSSFLSRRCTQLAPSLEILVTFMYKEIKKDKTQASAVFGVEGCDHALALFISLCFSVYATLGENVYILESTAARLVPSLTGSQGLV